MDRKPNKIEDSFRDIVSDFPGAVFRCKKDFWNFQYISPNINSITGFSHQEHLLDDNNNLQNLIYSEDLHEINDILDEKKKHLEAYVLEYRIRNAKGEERWIYERGTFKEIDGEIFRDGILLDISEEKKSAENFEFLATHDPLTKLPNRTLFFDRLNQSLAKAKRIEWPLALFFIDLDNFKSINDSFGHSAGDKVLITVSNRLKKCLREVDTIARLGGDEFIILLENTVHKDFTNIVAKKLNEALKNPIEIQPGLEVTVTASIGISPYIRGDKAETLLQKADAAMYQAKKKGKSNFQVYAKN